MQILQLATALPEEGFSNKDLMEAFPCTLSESVKQNILNLGVSKRYLMNGDGPLLHNHEACMNQEGFVDLCTEACTSAMRKTSLSARNIDYLIATYDANPFLSPGLSQLLVPSLNLDNFVKHVNVQGIASTAFPKALELAKDHLAAHPKDNVLICVSGVSSFWFQNQVRGLSEIMDMKQINALKDEARQRQELRKWVATIQYFLFGDGVAAIVVAKEGEGFCFDKIVEITNVSRTDYLAGFSQLTVLNEPFKFGFFSNLDKEIPKLGVKYTSLALERLLGKKENCDVKTPKKWAVHTGSEKILNAFAEHNEIENEKLKESYEILANYGNLGGASLPFILEKINSDTKLADGDLVLMVGYGWGFSASACSLEFKK